MSHLTRTHRLASALASLYPELQFQTQGRVLVLVAGGLRLTVSSSNTCPKVLDEETLIQQFSTNFLIDAEGRKVTYTPLLHHFTTLVALKSILKDNALHCGEPYPGETRGAVSFTYNAAVPETLGSLVKAGKKDGMVRLIFDEEKLGRDYKLEPFLFQEKKKFTWETKDELEARVVGDVVDLSRYLVRVDILGDAAAAAELRRLYPHFEIQTVEKFG